MDLSIIGDLMRKTQASIVEKGLLSKNTDAVIYVSMCVFLFEFGWSLHWCGLCVKIDGLRLLVSCKGNVIM